MKSKEKRNVIIKIVLGVSLVILLIPLLIKLKDVFINISTEEGRNIFKNEITSLGFKGVLVIIGLMIAQIFLFIIPGEPVEILAGMCYGSIGGLCVIYLGTFISTCLIMLLIRKFGRKFIYKFINKDKIEKLENNKVFKSKNLDIILIVLFALPGTPKDLLTYVGAFLPINPLKFLLISTLSRFPSIITSTIMGNNILDGNWFFIISVYVITFSICGILFYFFNKKEKIVDVMKL